jgi:hypothetical protein
MEKIKDPVHPSPWFFTHHLQADEEFVEPCMLHTYQYTEVGYIFACDREWIFKDEK